MTVLRRRTVSSAAVPSAARASAAPAPTRALGQSKPSPKPVGELETNVGASAGEPLIAFTDEYPEATPCDPPEPLGELAGGAIELTDEYSEPPTGWLESFDPLVIALTEDGSLPIGCALAVAGIASAQTPRASARARRRRAFRLRLLMVVMV